MKIAGGAVAVVALLGVGAVAYIRSPAGLDLIEKVADGAKAGRFGQVSVDGLSGDPFNELRAARIALSDVNGEWLIIDNADVSLNPLALLWRTVEIKSVNAAKVCGWMPRSSFAATTTMPRIWICAARMPTLTT